MLPTLWGPTCFYDCFGPAVCIYPYPKIPTHVGYANTRPIITDHAETAKIVVKSIQCSPHSLVFVQLL